LGEAEPPPAGWGRQFEGVPFPGEHDGCFVTVWRVKSRGLVADAKQQIQAAGAGSGLPRAVSAERRLSFETVGAEVCRRTRGKIANETAATRLNSFQQEADEHSRTAHAAAAEALRTNLPRWLGARNLSNSRREPNGESLAGRRSPSANEHSQQLERSAEILRAVCREAEETAARLKGPVRAVGKRRLLQAQSRRREHSREAAMQREEGGSWRNARR